MSLLEPRRRAFDSHNRYGAEFGNKYSAVLRVAGFHGAIRASIGVTMQIANAPPPGATTNTPVSSAHFFSSTESQLTLAIIALGVLVIIVMAFVLRSKNASADDAIRAFSVTLIIIGTMVLIAAGYSNDQIAPAMGLFGTVAGYLLGRKGAQQ